MASALEKARESAQALARARAAMARAEAFKAWFGASKEIDAEGRPRVFYHATRHDFDTFKAGGNDPTLSGAAIWLSPYADYQAAMHNVGGGGKFREGANVMPLYVKMERPLVIDDTDMLAWAREVFANGSKEFPQLLAPDWIKAIREEYDGIIFSAWNDSKTNAGRNEEHIVFEPSQVKSAIGNSGAFDPASPSVLDAVEPDHAGEWAAFDGIVAVSHAALDAADENVVLRQLLSDLAAAQAGRAVLTKPHQRAAMDERIRTLVRRIEMRRAVQPVRLQNRDRSTAASIAQMKAIAANPDPDLLGYSKVATDGAPMVFADYDEMTVPAAQLGAADRVTFAKDMSKVPVRWAVVEADDVLVSHDTNGAVVEGYEAQEAPGKLRAVAGNGRAAGVKAAHVNGTAARYVEGLIEDSRLHGVAPEAIRSLKHPMLVRIMRFADVSADIGDKTNTTGTAGLSSVEHAKNDGERIDFAAMSFNEDGTPTIDALTRFVQSMPQAEQATLAPDGAPTTQALDRMMAATFARAYQSDELVKLYSQSLDPEIKNVLFGMAQAAGDMAALAGKGEYDIRHWVTDAASMASNAKRAGLPLSRLAEQRDMAMDEAANDIAAMFGRNARSAKKIADSLRDMARAALETADSPAEDMFGPVEKMAPVQIVQKSAAD